MHVRFIPYGRRTEVERMLREMEAQKHKLKLYKGDEVKEAWITGGVRVLPLGIYEYIFPKEDLDKVLTTLSFDEDRYDIKWFKTALLRRITKSKKAPKFKNDQKYLWYRQNVNIIPIGIKEDTEITEPRGDIKGWRHEAI